MGKKPQPFVPPDDATVEEVEDFVPPADATVEEVEPQSTAAAQAEQPSNGNFIDLGKAAVSAAVGLGKSAWNTAFNQVPKEFRLEDLRNSQGTLADYLNPSGASIQSTKFDFPDANSLRTGYGQWINHQSAAVRAMPNTDRAALYLKQTVGEEKAQQLSEKFNTQLSGYRQNILSDVERQNKESKSLLKGETQSVRDVKNVGQAGSYVGQLAGQGVGRIVSSAATLGAGSFIAERAAGYEGQLDKLAQLASDQTGVSPENAKKAIIKLNQDKPEAGRVLSDLAGLLDVASLGTLGQSTMWKSVVPVIFEVATEIGQSEIEEKVASMGAGTPYQYDPVRSLDSGLGAVIGAKAVQTVGSAIQNNANTGDPKINKEIDNAAGLSPAEAEQLKVKPNETQIGIGTEVQGANVQNQQGEGSVQPSSSSSIDRTQEVRGQENGGNVSQGTQVTQPLNPTTNAIQEQGTSSEVPHPGEAGQDLTQGSQGVRPGQQGQETTLPLSQEEKVNQPTNETTTQSQEEKGGQETLTEEEKVENELQERIKIKRKVLQDRVHQLYADWINSGQEEMPDELRQAKKNLDSLDGLTKQREERLAAEKMLQGKEKIPSSGEETAPAKISSNTRYKAQQAKVAQAEADELDSRNKDDHQAKVEAVKAERASLNEIVKDLMRKQEVTAEKAKSETVVTTIAKLRAEFYKHMEQGAKFGRKALNDLLVKINDVADEHKLTAKQVRTLVNLVRRTNVNSNKHQAKFDAKVKEIAGNADYAEELDTAERLRGLIKKSVRGRQAKDVHKAAKLFSRIDPSELGRGNLGPYLGHAYDIVNHYKKPGGDAYAPVTASDIQIYAEQVNADQRQSKIDKVRDEYGFGSEVSDQDILDYLDNEEGQEDPFAANASETNKKIIRDKLLKTAEYAQLGLKEADIDGKEHKAKADLITRMDLTKLSNAQLVDYVRTVDDITVNDDFSGTDRLAARAEAIENAAKLRELLKGLKLFTANAFKKNIYSLPQIFKLVYSQSKVAAEAYRLSGLDGYFNSTARVENQEDQQNAKFLDTFKKLNKKHKDFDRAHTQVDASIFATLVRYVKGADPTAALARSKENVETSIARLKGKKEHQAIAADAEASYAKFKDAKTIDEVFTIMEKESPGAFAMWKFWRDSYKNEIMERLKTSSKEFYNNDFVEEENYTPKKFVTLEGNIPEAGENDFYGLGNSIGGRKASVTSQAATNNLRPQQSIDFNFYDNMFKGWRESLYQIESTKPQQILHEFLGLPESAELLGGEENRKSILETWQKSNEIAHSYGGTTGSKIASELTNTFKLLSNIKALGGIYQFPKQYLSVAVSTLGNLGKNAGLFFTTKIPEGADKLFDQYSIGNRGKRLAGAERGESRNHHLQSAYASRWLKSIGAINGYSEKGAHAFLYALRKGDVSVAKRSWAAYYLSSLKESGVDIKNINLADEASLQDQEVRKKAAAFAEQKVKETQLTSNPEEQAMALKSKGAAANAIKNMVIPFSSFAINTKVRVIEAFNQLRKKPGSTEAWKELGAVASEIAVYNGVKTYLLGMVTNTLLKPAIEGMFDVEGGGGDPEKEKKRKQNQKFWSDIYKDVMPTSIGSGGTAATVLFANYVNYLINNPHISFQKWQEKKKELFSNYSKEGFDYGLYGVMIEGIKETAASTKMTYDIMKNKPIYIQNQWGKDEHVRLTPREERFMMIDNIFEYASIFGTMDADVFNAFQKTKRELLKRGKKRAQERDVVPVEPAQ